MAIAWDVFDVCDREKILEAIKRPQRFKSSQLQLEKRRGN